MISRTYGWIQNPSDFNKLRKTVEIFDSSTAHYKDLKNKIIQREIVFFDDIRNNLQTKLDNNIETFSYTELVGTSMDKHGKSPKKRKNAEANALIQISLIPQQSERTGKNFTDDWTSDGFLRWAVSLNLVTTNREEDTFKITEKGTEFLQTKPESEDETNFLRKLFLSYPPATRVLNILSSDRTKKYYTKFEIGNKLGFIGESGFTSYDNELMVDWLRNADTPAEVTKARSDVEGTSDKYARMISGWLKKVGFVGTKKGDVLSNSKNATTGFQKYYITGKGLHSLRRAQGSSKNNQQKKFIMWEFLGVKGSDRDYNRMRRAKIIKFLEKSTSYKSLLSYINSEGFEDHEKVILNDIKGINNSGIRISKNGNNIRLLDTLNDFSLPDISVTRTDTERSQAKLKEKYLRYIDYDSKYIELLEIAYDGRRNLDFEMLTAELIKNIYKISAEHLGGGRKPDGVAFTNEYGVIFDTKAYKNGYGKNISQADEMIRYINDNSIRDNKRNPNEWWEVFPETIPSNSYYFLWISSKFVRRFNEQLTYTARATKTKGGALNVEQLLIGANEVYNGRIKPKDLDGYFNNEEIIFREI